MGKEQEVVAMGMEEGLVGYNCWEEGMGKEKEGAIMGKEEGLVGCV